MAKIKNKARADGRLQSKVYIGDGRYKYVYANNSKELAEKVQEIKLLLGKGIDISAQKDTFGFWGEKWLKKKSARVSQNWLKALKTNYKKLAPIMGIEVAKLRRSDLEDILDDLSIDGYSARVIKAVKDIACGIVNLCVDNRVIEFNPFEKSEVPKTKAPEERRALTAEEMGWIEDTPHRAQTAAMIMMYAGLRRGELIPLLWSDIDLKKGTINVSKSVEMLSGQPSLKSGGKTESANRIVYIPKRLISYLEQVKKTPFELVCPSKKGKMMSDSAWRRMWDSYITDLNLKYGDFENCFEWQKNHTGKPKSKHSHEKIPIIIPRFTAHWLRHTFITLMYLSGVDVLTAAEQAGHSDVKVTMKIYTHLNAQHKLRAIGKMDDYIDGCQMGVEKSV